MSATLALAGCVNLPTAPEVRGGRDLSTLRAVDLRDGRARFREIFCDRLRESVSAAPATSCEDWLWRLRDERPIDEVASSTAGSAARTTPASQPRLVIVTGAFSDCFGRDALPFGDVLGALRARGHLIETIQVSGRSGATHNARQIVDALRALPSSPGERLALLGYSKGAIDILQALVDAPDIGQRVAAVISLAGPIGGTPLADTGRWWYDHLAARAWSRRCDPGDGGVVDSLSPATRRNWLADHTLPATIAFYSLAALPQRDRLAAVLRGSSRLLARADRWNDGQVTVADALLPGSTMLGLLNADHWGVALRIERTLPRLAARRDPRVFPQDALLEAVLQYVAERPPHAAPMAPATMHR